MLGKLDDPAVVHLQEVIPTQSVTTLFTWATSCAAGCCLPLWHARRPDDGRADALVDAARRYAAGACTKAQLKGEIRAMRDAARELDAGAGDTAVEVACARALSTAAAVATTPTSALGFVFYLVAAVAYDELGAAADADALDEAASRAIDCAARELDRVAVADEPHPSNVDFSC
ncbi:MAG: hypothetical protein SOI46_02610 [Eggerthellaceae bacterium]|jgi:hypothetical protein